MHSVKEESTHKSSSSRLPTLCFTLGMLGGPFGQRTADFGTDQPDFFLLLTPTPRRIGLHFSQGHVRRLIGNSTEQMHEIHCVRELVISKVGGVCCSYQ
jgi:hypothetical protein